MIHSEKKKQKKNTTEKSWWGNTAYGNNYFLKLQESETGSTVLANCFVSKKNYRVNFHLEKHHSAILLYAIFICPQFSNRILKQTEQT